MCLQSSDNEVEIEYVYNTEPLKFFFLQMKF